MGADFRQGLMILFVMMLGAATALADAPDGAVVLGARPALGTLPDVANPFWPGTARVHVLVEGRSSQARRQMVRIADMFPGYALEFQFSPAPHNAAPVSAQSNLAQGAGVVIWRIAGLPPSDPRATFARYEGALKDGSPHGNGILHIRDGYRYSGDWAGGRPHGQGHETTQQGAHNLGSFANSQRHGAGRLAHADRAILQGQFVRVLPTKNIALLKPEGTRDSDVVALLPAQSGDMASHVSIALRYDPQPSSEQSITYQLTPGTDRSLIYTRNPGLISAWNASEPLPLGSDAWGLFDQPWDEIYADLNVDLLVADGANVALEALWLEVGSSVASRKPILQLGYDYNAPGFASAFEIYNKGTGTVTAASLEFRFLAPDGTPSDQFTLPLTAFNAQGSFDVEPALRHLGVDVDGLKGARFPCPSYEALQQCFAHYLPQIRLGNAARFAGILDNWLMLDLHGHLTFSWQDAAGQTQTATQPLRARVTLARMDT